MEVIKVTKDNYDEIVMNNDKTVVVDFYADWCGPCKMQAPIVDALAEELEDVQFCKINIDDEVLLAVKNQVASIPTIMVVKKGEITYRQPGLLDEDELRELIEG